MVVATRLTGISAAIWLLVTGAASAVASTWTVERDGSGDFVVIQDAVNNAAPGDSILIGPGHYTESAPFAAPGGTVETHVAVTVDDLTFIGADRDQVVIGPESPVIGGGEPVGFVNPMPRMRVENVTLENVFDGMNVAGDEIVVRNCSFRNFDTGLVSSALYRTHVEGCSFIGGLSVGVLVFGSLGSTGVEIRNSEFRNNTQGVQLQTNGNLVSECGFFGGLVGLVFTLGASGSVVDCEFNGAKNRSVALNYGSECELVDCVFVGAGENLSIWNESHVTGSGNIFAGGTYATLRFLGQGTAELHGNHILETGAPRVVVDSRAGPGHSIDLRENYWGTTSAVEIAGSIIDSQDDPSITGTVLFEPFLGMPVSAEASSFGRVKALFADDK